MSKLMFGIVLIIATIISVGAYYVIARIFDPIFIERALIILGG